MIYYWNGLQILAEEIVPDEWEASLEYDEEGPRGKGHTELAARADLRNTLSQMARTEAAMMDAAMCDRAEAMTERRAGL